MKRPVQPTLAIILATLCAIAWFAFWLSAFEPTVQPQIQEPRPLAAAFCPAANETLQAPTLFALPSEQGFSGVFPEQRVNVDLSLERPRQPETYLSRQPVATATPDQTQLIESIPLPQNKLPAPGATRTVVIRQPERIALFFSPELKPRASEIKSISEIDTLSSASVRIRLTVRPDGSVAHAFFETPIKQPALLSAIRKLRFTATDKETVGWLDIRYTPTAGEML